MSTRAKGYVSLIAFRHIITGVICLTLPYIFESPSFQVIKTWAPIWWWGVVMIMVGLLALGSVISGRSLTARLSIILSLALTSLWAGGFITDAIIYTDTGHRGVASPVWATAWIALCGKDLILSAMPLRSPFEDLLDPAEAR